jgi:Domain of unknown function (DUF4158)
MAKRWDHMRLGFAVQLVTVRFLGTFVDDLATVPARVVDDMARQLSIGNPDCITVYRDSRARWQHAREIRIRRSGSAIVSSSNPLCAFVLRDGCRPCAGPAPKGQVWQWPCPAGRPKRRRSNWAEFSSGSGAALLRRAGLSCCPLGGETKKGSFSYPFARFRPV